MVEGRFHQNESVSAPDSLRAERNPEIVVARLYAGFCKTREGARGYWVKMVEDNPGKNSSPDLYANT